MNPLFPTFSSAYLLSLFSFDVDILTDEMESQSSFNFCFPGEQVVYHLCFFCWELLVQLISTFINWQDIFTVFFQLCIVDLVPCLKYSWERSSPAL